MTRLSEETLREIIRRANPTDAADSEMVSMAREILARLNEEG